MSDIKLFRYSTNQVYELEGRAAVIEKQLQNLIEQEMETFLGVRFLASEYTTGKTHKGRIDSLGIDENGCPVIIEYKRHSNENVINQGLFYLDWLLDHQAEYRWLVMEKLGKEDADSIEWSGTRLLCIAGDFTRYDQHAVQQINRNVELIRYRLFGEDMLMLELVNAVSSQDGKSSRAISRLPEPDELVTDSPALTNSHARTHSERLAAADDSLIQLYQSVCEVVENLGDEVQRKELKLYTAFKKLRNFVCVVITSTRHDPQLKLYLNLNPDSVTLIDGHVMDARGKGHWGTGNLELTIRTSQELEQRLPLIERAYQEN